MLKLTPSHVNAARTLAVWALRGAATLVLGVGAYFFLKKALFGLGSGVGFLEMTFRVWDGTGEEHSTYRGLAMLIVGGALALGARRIARWMISAPEEGCPRCGYAGGVSDTCPECGQSGMAGGEGGTPGAGAGSVRS